jgi:Tol biopolymer transport system component
MHRYRFLSCFLPFLLTGCSHVIYMHHEPSVEQPPNDHSQIYRMLPEGSSQTNLSNRPRDEFAPDVRHDGKKIVFQAGTSQVYVMNTDGTAVTLVPNTPFNLSSPRWSKGTPTWFILFVYPADTAQAAVWRINPDGTDLAQITHPGPNEKDELAEGVSGNYIVLSRHDLTTDDDDLWVKYLWDSRPEQRLTHTPDRSETLPVVSHSGELLAYRLISGQSDQVCVARWNSESSITVLNTISLRPPAGINISGLDFEWDDRRLFVSTQATDVSVGLINRKQEIFRVSLDGSEQIRLTTNTAEDTTPSAAP